MHTSQQSINLQPFWGLFDDVICVDRSQVASQMERAVMSDLSGLREAVSSTLDTQGDSEDVCVPLVNGAALTGWIVPVRCED